MEEDCIFCKIAKGEILCEKIWEDEDFLAFLDIKPVGPGHTLLITKKHFDNLSDVDDEIGNKYVPALQKTTEVLMEKYDAEGFNLVLNNGEVAGQIVKHVHFHLLPRKKDDGQRGIFIG